MTTKADQARLDTLHDMPCVCCVEMRIDQPFETEAHHIVDGGYRKHSGGHQSTLPLCSYHHRGKLKQGLNSKEMEKRYGPSLELNKRLFKVVFGTERELLARINSLLAEHS